MSYSTIIEGLAQCKSTPSWNAVLLKYNHKTKPNEYTCYDLNFETSDLLKSTISTMCDCFLSIVDKYDKQILTYTGSNPKNSVDKLPISDPVIQNNWNLLLNSINISDNNPCLANIKADAYIFVGEYCIDGVNQNIYLITRKNPILSYKKKIFAGRNNTLTDITEPLVQFNKSFDALVYKNTLYMINNNCESIFNMEYTHKIICKKCLDELASVNLIDDFECYKTFASAKQNPKKFINYDSELVIKLSDLSHRQKLSTLLKIPLTIPNSQFDIKSDENAKNFTSAICGKTKINLLDDSLCEVPSSTPLNL